MADFSKMSEDELLRPDVSVPVSEPKSFEDMSEDELLKPDMAEGTATPPKPEGRSLGFMERHEKEMESTLGREEQFAGEGLAYSVLPFYGTGTRAWEGKRQKALDKALETGEIGSSGDISSKLTGMERAIDEWNATEGAKHDLYQRALNGDKDADYSPIWAKKFNEKTHRFEVDRDEDGNPYLDEKYSAPKDEARKAYVKELAAEQIGEKARVQRDAQTDLANNTAPWYMGLAHGATASLGFAGEFALGGAVAKGVLGTAALANTRLGLAAARAAQGAKLGMKGKTALTAAEVATPTVVNAVARYENLTADDYRMDDSGNVYLAEKGDEEGLKAATKAIGGAAFENATEVALGAVVNKTLGAACKGFYRKCPGVKNLFDGAAKKIGDKPIEAAKNAWFKASKTYADVQNAVHFELFPAGEFAEEYVQGFGDEVLGFDTRESAKTKSAGEFTKDFIDWDANGKDLFFGVMGQTIALGVGGHAVRRAKDFRNSIDSRVIGTLKTRYSNEDIAKMGTNTRLALAMQLSGGKALEGMKYGVRDYALFQGVNQSEVDKFVDNVKLMENKEEYGKLSDEQKLKLAKDVLQFNAVMYNSALAFENGVDGATELLDGLNKRMRKYIMLAEERTASGGMKGVANMKPQDFDSRVDWSGTMDSAGNINWQTDEKTGAQYIESRPIGDTGFGARIYMRGDKFLVVHPQGTNQNGYIVDDLKEAHDFAASLDQTAQMRNKEREVKTEFIKHNVQRLVPATVDKKTGKTMGASVVIANDAMDAVNSFDWLSEKDKEALVAAAENGTEGGGFRASDGTVIMLRDNIRDANDALLTLAHEIGGHVAIKEGAKDNGLSLIYTIAEVFKTSKTKDTEQAKTEYRIRRTEGESKSDARATAQEEGMVYGNEYRMPVASPLQKAKTAVKTWMKKHGIDAKMTDDDYIAIAAAGLKRIEQTRTEETNTQTVNGEDVDVVPTVRGTDMANRHKNAQWVSDYYAQREKLNETRAALDAAEAAKRNADAAAKEQAKIDKAVADEEERQKRIAEAEQMRKDAEHATKYGREMVADVLNGWYGSKGIKPEQVERIAKGATADEISEILDYIELEMDGKASEGTVLKIAKRVNSDIVKRTVSDKQKAVRMKFKGRNNPKAEEKRKRIAAEDKLLEKYINEVQMNPNSMLAFWMHSGHRLFAYPRFKRVANKGKGNGFSFKFEGADSSIDALNALFSNVHGMHKGGNREWLSRLVFGEGATPGEGNGDIVTDEWIRFKRRGIQTASEELESGLTNDEIIGDEDWNNADHMLKMLVDEYSAYEEWLKGDRLTAEEKALAEEIEAEKRAMDEKNADISDAQEAWNDAIAVSSDGKPISNPDDVSVGDFVTVASDKYGEYRVVVDDRNGDLIQFNDGMGDILSYRWNKDKGEWEYVETQKAADEGGQSGDTSEDRGLPEPQAAERDTGAAGGEDRGDGKRDEAPSDYSKRFDERIIAENTAKANADLGGGTRVTAKVSDIRDENGDSIAEEYYLDGKKTSVYSMGSGVFFIENLGNNIDDKSLEDTFVSFVESRYPGTTVSKRLTHKMADFDEAGPSFKNFKDALDFSNLDSVSRMIKSGKRTEASPADSEESEEDFVKRLHSEAKKRTSENGDPRKASARMSIDTIIGLDDSISKFFELERAGLRDGLSYYSPIVKAAKIELERMKKDGWTRNGKTEAPSDNAAASEDDALTLDGGTAQEIAAEQKRVADRKEIERRQNAPLKSGMGEVGQSLMDLGGAEGEDLFNRTVAEIRDEAKDGADTKTVWRRLQKAGFKHRTEDEFVRSLREDKFADGETKKVGAQSIVYRAGDKVYKFRDVDGNVKDAVKKIEEFNKLFPDMAYNIHRETMTDNGGKERLVLEQPYVDALPNSGTEARKQLVSALKERFGAENVKAHGDINEKNLLSPKSWFSVDAGPWHIEDLKDLNLGIDRTDGKVKVWDAEISYDAAKDAVGKAKAKWRRIGEKGAWNLGIRNQEDAIRMEAEGASHKDTWEKTGWFRAKDGKWRYEIDPISRLKKSGMSRMLNGEVVPLKDVISDKKLFIAYPDMESVVLKQSDARGIAQTTKNTILYPPDIAKFGRDEIVKMFNHEIQHLIQIREGMSQGTGIGGLSRMVNASMVAQREIAKKYGVREIYLTWFGDSMSDIVKIAKDAGIENHPLYNRLVRPDDFYDWDYEKQESWENDNEMLQTDAIRDDYDYRDLVSRLPIDTVAEIRKKISSAIRRQMMIKEADDLANSREYNDRNWYRDAAGEVEARSVETRALMPKRKRKEIAPWESEDVPRDEQYIDYVKRDESERMIGGKWRRRTYTPNTSAQYLADLRVKSVTDALRNAKFGADNAALFAAEKAARELAQQGSVSVELRDLINATQDGSVTDRAKGSLKAMTSPQTLSRMREKFQDSLISMRELEDRLGIAKDRSVYHQFDRNYGIVTKEVDDLNREIIAPLAKELETNKIPLADFSMLLQALHGPERNRMIAERSPYVQKALNDPASEPYVTQIFAGGIDVDDAQVMEICKRLGWVDKNGVITKEGKAFKDDLAGSGATTAYWNGKIDEFRRSGMFAKADKAVKLVRKLTRRNRALLVATGRMSRAQASLWAKLSPNYVPLRSDMEMDTNLWSRWFLGGESNRNGGTRSYSDAEYNHAYGRGTLADNPLEFAIQQYHESLQRSYDNVARQRLAEMVRQNPNLGKVFRYEPRMTATKRAHYAKAIAILQNKIAAGTATDKDRERLRWYQEAFNADTNIPLIKVLGANGIVHEMPNLAGLEGTPDKPTQIVAFKEGGELKFIKLGGFAQGDVSGNPNLLDDVSARRIATAVKKQNMARLNAFGKLMRKATGIFSALRTAYSPTFIVSNFGADNTQAARNIYATFGVGAVGKFEHYAFNSFGAAKAVLSGNFGNTKIQQYAKEWYKNGGKIGGLAVSNISDLTNEIKRTMRKLNSQKQQLANIHSAKDLLAWATDRKDDFEKLAEKWNSVVEMSTRIAAYATARDMGQSVADAVSYSRDITVNFNRKGTLTPWLNAFYAFSNASIQDLHRSLVAFGEGRVGTGAAILAGRGVKMGVGLAFMGFLASLFGFWQDDPDDEKEGKAQWKYAKDWQKQNTMGVRIGEKVYGVPIRGLSRIPYYFGHQVYEMMTGRKNVVKAAADTVGLAASSAMDFMGQASTPVNTLVPSVLRPGFDIQANKTFTGQQLYREPLPGQEETAVRSEMGRKGTSDAAKFIAKALNVATGGDEGKRGLVDVQPEKIAAVWDWVFGSAGKDIANITGTTMDIATLNIGNRELRNIPYLSRFARKLDENSADYYEARNEYDKAKKHFSSMAELGNEDKMRSDVEEYPWLSSRGDGKRWGNELKDLDGAVKKLLEIEKSASPEQYDNIHQLRLKTQYQFMRRLNTPPKDDAEGVADEKEHKKTYAPLLRSRKIEEKREKREKEKRRRLPGA